jgi:hypothetical protein
VLVVQDMVYVALALEHKEVLLAPSLQSSSSIQPKHPSCSYLPPMYEIERRGLTRVHLLLPLLRVAFFVSSLDTAAGAIARYVIC